VPLVTGSTDAYLFLGYPVEQVLAPETFNPLIAKIVETPKPLLLPLILMLSAVGAYAINNNPADVDWMLGFGVLGYILKMYGFQVGPISLGMILAPMMDRPYLTFTILSQTRWWQRLRGRARVNASHWHRHNGIESILENRPCWQQVI